MEMLLGLVECGRALPLHLALWLSAHNQQRTKTFSMLQKHLVVFFRSCPTLLSNLIAPRLCLALIRPCGVNLTLGPRSPCAQLLGITM